MKKIFLNLAAFANIKIDQAAIDSNDQMVVSEADFEKINTALEEAKGYKSAAETAAKELADIKSAQLTAETSAQEAATAAATAASMAASEIATLNAEVARLGALSGGEETKIKKEELDAKTLGLPAHCDASLEIYQMLEQTS